MPNDPSVWSPAMVSAIIGGLVLLLGAVTSMIVTLSGLRKKADETALKVDGHMSAMAKERAVLQAENDGLKKLVASATEARQDAVQAVATVAAAKETAK